MSVNIDFKRLVRLESKDAATYTFVTFITGLGSFLIVPLFWSKLSPSDYGIIAITEVIAGFFGGFAGLSLDQGQTRFYHEWPDSERKARTGTLWIANWLGTLLIGSLLFLLLFYVNDYVFPGIDFYPYIFYGLVITILNSFSLFPFATLRIMQLTRTYTVFRLVTFFIGMGFHIWFVLIQNKGVAGYLQGSIYSGIITLLILAVLMLSLSEIKLNRSHLVHPLKYCLPLIPSSMMSSISQHVDKLMLQHFIDLRLLGLYSVSLKFASLIAQLHSALKLSYVPFLFKTVSVYKENWKLILSRMNNFYIFPLFLLIFGISLFIDDYVLITGQESYAEIGNIVPVLSYIALLPVLYLYLSPGILISKRTNLLLIPVICQLAIQVGFGLVLLPKFQITGILITNFLAGSVYLLITIHFSNKVSDWRANYSTFFKFLFFSISSIFIRNFIPSGTFFQNFALDLFIFSLYTIFGIVLLRKLFNENQKEALTVPDHL